MVERGTIDRRRCTLKMNEGKVGARFPNRTDGSAKGGPMPIARAAIATILLLLTRPSFGKDSPWKSLALEDLEAIKELINENHPGIVDDENLYFKTWLKRGYQEAKKSASKASSFDEYYYLTKRFINGFKDGHLYYYMTVERTGLRWPGFVVAYRGKRFVVHSLSDNPSFQQLPNKGDELVSCDGKNAASLMRGNVFLFSGNEDLPAHWINFAPYLLVDYGNPYFYAPKFCTFSGGAKVKLDWQDVRSEQVKTMLLNAGFGPAPEFALREVSPGVHWISMPTFDAGGGHVGALKSYIEKISSLKNASAIVFDVRGNNGGSSEWGSQLVGKLYGMDVLSYVEGFQTKDQSVEYRVSDGNIAHFEKVVPFLATQYGRDAHIVQHFAKVLDGMKASRKSGKKLFKAPETDRDGAPRPTSMPKHDVTAKVFLLTDGNCASACLNFADLLLAMPGVVQVGAPTSADTNYMEVRGIDLPSGIARLSVATKVYRNRPRGHNKFYSPKHEWDGDMGDTPGLQEWIVGLAK